MEDIREKNKIIGVYYNLFGTNSNPYSGASELQSDFEFLSEMCNRMKKTRFNFTAFPTIGGNAYSSLLSKISLRDLVYVLNDREECVMFYCIIETLPKIIQSKDPKDRETFKIIDIYFQYTFRISLLDIVGVYIDCCSSCEDQRSYIRSFL